MIKSCLIGLALMALCLLPQIVKIVFSESWKTKTFQDPDDYTQLLIAEESWEKGAWCGKSTYVDSPISGRPDHWSQIPRIWFVAGAATIQFFTGQSKREALASWGYWANAPLLLLAAALLSYMFFQKEKNNSFAAALCACIVLNLPTTRWSTNFGHPDHHIWIITAIACITAASLTRKTRCAGVFLGITHALSPLSFIPLALGAGIITIIEPSPTNRKTLFWAAGTALTLWIAEYWKHPQIIRLDAPSPWIPILLALTAASYGLRSKTTQQTLLSAITILLAGSLAFHIFHSPDIAFTPLSKLWKEYTITEGIYYPTKWWDPLYFLPLLPAAWIALKNRKAFAENPLATGMTSLAIITASKMVRAHEIAAACAPCWIIKLPTPPLKKWGPYILGALTIIPLALPGPELMGNLKPLAEKIPEGSLIASSPTFCIPIAYFSNSTTPTSHHWECWPQNTPLYELLSETNENIFLQKAQKLGIQYLIFGTDQNAVPNQGIPQNFLIHGIPSKGLEKLETIGKMHLYKISYP